ncbi:MAG: hypothetical protein KGQ37_09445 [Hyphomicrobiales bacterium]|nr:hypothetical protein [Hyphomicrobiales bacterium]
MNVAYSAMTGGNSAVSQPPGTGRGMFSSPTASGSLAAMQMGSSAIGMFGAMQAGQNIAGAYNSASSDAKIESQGALVQGAGQVAGLRQNLTQLMAQRNVLAGAGGVDVGQGVAAQNRNIMGQSADAQTGIDLAGARINAAKYQISSLNDQLLAEQAKQSGIIGALGSGLGLGLSLLMRG